MSAHKKRWSKREIRKAYSESFRQLNASVPSSWRPLCKQPGCKRISEQGGRFCHSHARLPAGGKALAGQGQLST